MRKEIIAKIKKGTIMCAAAGAVAISGVAGVASAANAAVVKSVAENMVVGGVPAKIIGENSKHKLFVDEN